MDPDQFASWSSWWQASGPHQVGFALLFPFAVWLTRRWFARVATSLVSLAASKLEIVIPEAAQRAARPAAQAFCVALALTISFQLLGLPGVVAGWVEILVRLLLIFSIFWLIDAFIRQALAQLTSKDGHTGIIQKSWLPQFTRLLLALLMLVVILKSWGIDLGPALAGLGLAGAAVALAAQDWIRNLIAGVNIAGEQRFQEGDWVNFGAGTDGIVEKFQLRSTVIRKFDWSIVHVPNADLANAPLTNYSSREGRRLMWYIGVPFETDEDQLSAACARISDYIAASDEFVNNQDTDYYVTHYSIDASCLTILVYCFVSQNSWQAELRARNALVVAIRKIFADTGVEFAYPTQKIHADLHQPGTSRD